MFSHTLYIRKADISHDLKALEVEGFKPDYEAKGLSESRFTFQTETAHHISLEKTRGVDTYKIYDLDEDSGWGDNTPACIYSEYQRVK